MTSAAGEGDAVSGQDASEQDASEEDSVDEGDEADVDGQAVDESDEATDDRADDSDDDSADDSDDPVDDSDDESDRSGAGSGAESRERESGQRQDDGGDFVRARAPELPEDADISALDPEVKQELRGLPKGLAEIVGRHLAAAGMLIDSEPELALEHARYARTKAARVGVVREAAGLTAYYAGEWAEALSELRAARRMTHGAGHVAIMADCERALGRPERAIELAREVQGQTLSPDDAVELRIVAAGARRDMGQLEAAVVSLQGPDLDSKRRDPWSARLFYAYADNLAAAGRTEEAVKWFLNAAQADDDNETDAAERAFDLGPQD